MKTFEFKNRKLKVEIIQKNPKHSIQDCIDSFISNVNLAESFGYNIDNEINELLNKELSITEVCPSTKLTIYKIIENND